MIKQQPDHTHVQQLQCQRAQQATLTKILTN